jgi:hypothetical protein
MEREPYEALGEDESNLSVFVHPCHRCIGGSTSISKPKNLILGLAGILQATMINRDRDDDISTQEFVRNAFDKDRKMDLDFSVNPGLCVMQFVARTCWFNTKNLHFPLKCIV